MSNALLFGSFLSLFFALLLLLCNGCLCQNFSDCPNASCGTLFSNISYPFGLANSGCGHPAFQIHCVSGKPHLAINGVNYTVLDHKNNTLTVVNDEVFSNLPCPIPHGAVNLTASPFMVAPSYNTNLTLFLGCSFIHLPFLDLGCSVDIRYDWNYSPPPSVLLGDCKVIQVPIRVPQFQQDIIDKVLQGFEILWNESGEMFRKCRACEKRKGICGFNFIVSGVFVCSVPEKPNSTINGSSSGKGSNRGMLTGIVIGASALIMTVALFLIVLYRKRSFYLKGIQPSVATELMNSGSVVRVENFLQSYIHQMPTRYSFSQLKKITNNFADKLGEGGFGVVYKGKLRSGLLAAVKVLNQSRQSEMQFMNEVATLGTIHHIHLVRLMGYCFEEFRSALVYEYMANGSLEKFIFAEKGKEQMLNCDQLYSIALGSARGIAYLHQDCSPRIIHFDIKPHNILLDEDFTAKVADFGLAKLYGKAEDHVSITEGRGTPGYAAPEVWSRSLGAVTDKSDVYSFGMLLLEIAGRRKNIELEASRSSQLYFPEWAFKVIESGELEKRLRERGRGLEMELEDEEKVRRMAKVGLWCIQYNSNNRPSMSRVVEMLEGRGGDVSNPPLPFNSSPPRQVPLLSSFEESSSML